MANTNYRRGIRVKTIDTRVTCLTGVPKNAARRPAESSVAHNKTYRRRHLYLPSRLEFAVRPTDGRVPKNRTRILLAPSPTRQCAERAFKFNARTHVAGSSSRFASSRRRHSSGGRGGHVQTRIAGRRTNHTDRIELALLAILGPDPPDPLTRILVPNLRR